MEKKVFIKTYGCQMNVRDSQAMAGLLKNMGYEQTHSIEEADIIFVNTCSVREKAEQKVFSEIGRLSSLKKKKPELIIGVAGCVAQQEGEKIFDRFENLDLVFGTQVIDSLPLMLEKVKAGDRILNLDFVEEREKRFSPKRLRAKVSVKEYVTIMEGCENFCSYCIVPHTRGKEISRDPADILSEVIYLSEKGTSEIILVGQNVNSYGIKDNIEITFPQLLEKVCSVEGLSRVRFITSHPKDFNIELAEKFVSLPRLAKHLHLPVQAGSNRILERMNRGYSVEKYLSKIELLRELVPDISLSTDIIAGFPGEEDEDFENTLQLLKEVEFDFIYSFAFSPRPGTPAEKMENQIPVKVRLERLEEIQKLQGEITLKKNKALVGSVVEVLVEGRAKRGENFLTGRTECNRVVNFKGEDSLIGEIVKVKILEAYQNSLKAKII